MQFCKKPVQICFRYDVPGGFFIEKEIYGQPYNKEQYYNQKVAGTGFLLSFRITGGADFFGCALRQHSRSFLALLLIIKAGRRFRFVGNMKFVAAVFTTGMMVFYIGCQRSAAVWAFKII